MEGLERIKVLSADIKDKALKNIVTYLLSRQDMNEKYLNEEKSLKGMIEYIKSEAHKVAQDGVAMIEDSTVYNWAIHYWDESNKDLKIATKSNKEELTQQVNDTEELSPKIEPKKKISKKDWVSEGQLSLFDMM